MIVAPKSKQSNESIKVCIRVRPLLQHELMKDEIVYYPESKDPSLQVSLLLPNSLGLRQLIFIILLRYNVYLTFHFA